MAEMMAETTAVMRAAQSVDLMVALSVPWWAVLRAALTV